MHCLYKWFGASIGYRDDKSFFSYAGEEIGRFTEHDEIFGPDGVYIGELYACDRVVVNESKKKCMRLPFERVAGSLYAPPPDEDPYPPVEDYTEFPAPTFGVGFRTKT